MKISAAKRKALGVSLERLYALWNAPAYIHPDPLELVLPYQNIQDREIAALIASSLAYGRVSCILFSVSEILKRMNHQPRKFVEETSPCEMVKVFSGFKHRFHSGEDIACLLSGVRTALERFGSLEKCFLAGFDGNMESAEQRFSKWMCGSFPECVSTLVPSAKKGSACKRLNLMLRWLVRNDSVDPGGWDQLPASALIVPLDTHMHRISLHAGFTKRLAADMKTAKEITEAFAGFSPEDPVRYDFALTRFGINPDMPLLPPDL